MGLPPGDTPKLEAFDLTVRAEQLIGRKADLVFEVELDTEPRIRDRVLEDAVPL